MDYKYLLILLLLIPMSTALELNSGETHNIFNTSNCYGLAKLKVIGLEHEVDNRLIINNWTKITTNNWAYNCDGEPLNIDFYTPRKTSNTYNFILEYQSKDIEYTQINISEGLTHEQQEYQIYLRNKKLTNVKMKPQGFIISPDISIDMRNIILFVVLLFVMGATFLIVKNKKAFTSSSENNDSLNYSNKEDQDIEDILNQIK